MVFQGYTMPAPSGGLDLVSPIDNMEPSSALELVNVFPGASAPTVRNGYKQFCNLGTSSQVQFLYEYPSKNGTTQLIAAQNAKIYAISDTGTVTNISKTGGYASGKWNKELFGGNIYLANAYGEAPQVYKGTGLAANINATCRAGPSITELSHVFSYRNRLYFIQNNTFVMWYDKTVNAVLTTAPSVLDSYDFSYIMRRGGYLLFMGNYTNQNGINPQDYFVAVSSEGETVVYSGYSPDDPTWSLVAHFQIGKPLGPKAYVRVNQDFWIITQQGIVPMSALFQTDPEQALNIISRKINPLISQYSTQVGLSEMWSGFFWAQGRRVYITLPDSSGSATFLVYSIDQKSWTQFILSVGDHAVASCKFNSLPFYGSTTGIIYQGETGYADVVTATSSGQAINFSGRLAFSFYGSRGNYKAFKDIRPILKARRGIQVSVALDTNFQRQSTLPPIANVNSTYMAWGSVWSSPWSSDVDYIYDRHAIAGQGHSAAIRFAGSLINSPCQIIGFEVRYDQGGQV